MPNYISTCSLHWNRSSCVKPFLWWKTLIYWMDKCCRCTLELPLWGNSNVYQQHTLLKLRKLILKYTLNKDHVRWLSSFKHLKLPISIKIPVTIWQIVYIYMTAISLNLISWTMLLLTWQLHGCKKYEPQHVISNNVAFWQVYSQRSVYRLLLSLETTNAIQSEA